MDYAKESLRLHEQWQGKIEVTAAVEQEEPVRVLFRFVVKYEFR